MIAFRTWRMTFPSWISDPGGAAMGAEGELVAIVDERNKVIGAVPRREMRAGNLPHRATYILVFNSQGELYVQKRTQSKDVFPGYYDVAAGGVILAGESYEEGALRELEEELGIRGVPLSRLFDFSYNDEAVKVWGAVFSCVYDGEMALQQEEVESGAFLAADEVFRLAATEPFTPDGLYVLRRYGEIIGPG
jgi:isopentenyldiphosphate isomerase